MTKVPNKRDTYNPPKGCTLLEIGLVWMLPDKAM